MSNAIKEVYDGFKSLVTGMRITIGQFFKPTITVQYPHESLKMPTRFRGHIELVTDPETGKPLCFACKLCERACPSDCITVEGAKLEGDKKKSVTDYKLDFTKCSLCGSCVEACRDGAIRYSRDYNLASTSKEDFVMDLFKRLEREREAVEGPTGSAIPAAQKAPEAPVAAVPAPTPAAAAPAPAPAAQPATPQDK
ncbi:MAG: NADH-quinone oxidoreductase subunit I [Verrucomicrobiota bacterium]|jgi:NADH-quinone oxidoreductase subunit I|nr:NADH-quinone oxidoreductase subunit I [Verrucomicrobiota bacterium]